MTTLVSQFVNSSLFFKSAKYLKNLNNSGVKMIQIVLVGLTHHLAKFGARFAFTTDVDFLEGKLSAGKITVLRLCKLN